MSLLRSKADEGMSIVCATHALANLPELATRIVVMAVGGVLAFEGPPADALRIFGVDRLGAVIDRLGVRPATEWRSAFQSTRPTSAAPQVIDDEPKSLRRPQLFQTLGEFIQQTGVVRRRNLAFIFFDRRIWIMALFQSVVIGCLIGVVFGDFSPDRTRSKTQV